MKLRGTSVVKFDYFIDNIQELAGTCNSITRSEYDSNIGKICSYAHINKNFNMTWNYCLKMAGLRINKNFENVHSGRKIKNKTNYKTVSCLKCDDLFESFNPKLNRICPSCKNNKNFED